MALYTHARLGRIRYLGLYSLFSCIGMLAIIYSIIFKQIWLLLIVGMPCLVITFFLAIRRQWDFNANAWWSLVLFVPGASPIWLLVLFFYAGSPGENKFGPLPPPPTLRDYLLIPLGPLTFWLLLSQWIFLF